MGAILRDEGLHRAVQIDMLGLKLLSKQLREVLQACFSVVDLRY